LLQYKSKVAVQRPRVCDSIRQVLSTKLKYWVTSTPDKKIRTPAAPPVSFGVGQFAELGIPNVFMPIGEPTTTGVPQLAALGIAGVSGLAVPPTMLSE
jgi:hypothetical protein